MSCKPFKTSEANAKSYLRTQEVIDKYLNVKDLGKFRTEHSKLRQQAKDKYFPNVEGWNEKLFLENKQGTKVYPNKAVFKQIDKINGVKYKDSISFEPKEISEDTSFEPKEGVSDEVNYNLKSTNILLSDKANEVFKKGEKNKWPLEKILTELQVPKEQKKLILDLEFDTYYDELSLQENIAMELMNKYTYTVKINTAKIKKEGVDRSGKFNLDDDVYTVESYESYEGGNYIVHFKNNEEITEKEYDNALRVYNNTLEKIEDLPTNYYSTLTVPGGTNYTENEIATPGITPSIKGHAEFSTDNGIGWFRSDDKQILNPKGIFVDDTNNDIFFESLEKSQQSNEPTYISSKTRRILEVQSDLFQKGRDKKDLIGVTETSQGVENIYEKNGKYYFYDEYAGQFGEDPEIEITKERYEELKKGKINNENTFLQLLNKDNNWVNFFVKSVIQDSAKKGYKKVLFPSGME